MSESEYEYEATKVDAESGPTEQPTEPAEPTQTYLFRDAIKRAAGLVPISESRLIETLTQLGDAVGGEESGRVDPYWWRRALQLFGNRMHELSKPDTEGGEKKALPQWALDAKAILEAAADDALRRHFRRANGI